MGLDAADIRRAAREALGVERLLPGQREAIAAITDGRDTLALLPTGGGKSAIYQVAGLAIDGPTIVVSPLIALMHDQLASLRELGLPAGALHSGVPPAERESALQAIRTGELEFLLLSPEQLADPAIVEEIRRGRPSLFVVDEAHCVAEWGRDFRPEYRRLGAVADALGRPPILALTATASPLLRAEIVERLALRDPVVVARGFDRPNLTLIVRQFADETTKRRAVIGAVLERRPPGIVYCATRATAVAVAAELEANGVRAAAYHAGFGTRRRQDVQDAFMADEVEVIVATIAFGMGIDKPDVRFVIHHDVSESLDAYHQEIGRAGRDGDPADVVLAYRAEDLGLRRFQSAPPRLEEGDVVHVLRAIRRSAGADVPTLARAARRSRRRTEAVVGRLEELDLVRVEPDGSIRSLDGSDPRDPAALATMVVANQERRRAVERSRVEMIRGFAEAAGCRRSFLLGYFGEPFTPPCERCDRCLDDPAAVEQAAAEAEVASGYSVEDRVQHGRFGVGIVTGIEGDRMTVAFDRVGYKVLDISVASDGAGLTRVPVDDAP